MTDFLVTQMTLYPWMAWLLVVLAGAGLGYVAVWVYRVEAAAFAWLGAKRKDWKWKAAVRNVGEGGEHLCPSCLVMAERIGDDPPEYQPDEDDLDYCKHGVIRRTCTRCDELAEWEQDTAADERWGQDMADLAETLRLAHEAGYLDDIDLRRCDNEDCGLVGMLHNGSCDVPEAKLIDCSSESGGPWKYGPAMPPQPVREFLHPAINDDLAARGFSEHETTDGALDSMFTRAQARVVQAMITDGVVPFDVEGMGQEDDSDRS